MMHIIETFFEANVFSFSDSLRMLVVDEKITGGAVVITVSFHGVPVHAERNDICSRAECPIAPGDFTLENTQPLPRITPPVSSGQHPACCISGCL
jgi:hypothetical protein